MSLNRLTRVLLGLGILAALPVAAQDAPILRDAQAALAAADAAQAQVYAKTLYDEAAFRLRYARENWNAGKLETRGAAQRAAVEAAAAARAATAKARWLGTNAAIKGLQMDIVRFGGSSNVSLPDESSTIALAHGTTSKARVATAERVIDMAVAAGAEKNVIDNDLQMARDMVSSAKKVMRADTNNEIADSLAYRAEMVARRAYYLAQLASANRLLPSVQVERSRLANAETERQAAAERAQREEAERKALDLQRQLAAEQANRQSQSAELDRLRAQVDESRRALMARIEADRTSRAQAEQHLAELYRAYETALIAGSPAEIETLRRQIEDQQLTLNAIYQREAAQRDAMAAELAQTRDALAASEATRRQAELDQFRTELEAASQRRAEAEAQHQAAIADATKRRQEAEAQAAALRQQAEEAQRQTLAAQEGQRQAQEQAAASQQQLQQLQQQTQQMQQQTQQQIDAAATAAKQAQESAAATAAELERTRQQLADREAETRRLRLEQELAKIASTKSDPRGLVVTLPAAFFDTGKAVLKPTAKATLGKIANQLKSDANLKLTIEGHTDNVGSESMNQTLSEKRANAVRDYLAGAGISGDRITATGKGESSPIASNKTAAGRQQNRRVEIIIAQ